MSVRSSNREPTKSGKRALGFEAALVASKGPPPTPPHLRHGVVEQFEQCWGWSEVEPMTGIEPAYSAWEADVLPLNYIGEVDHEG